LPIGERRVNRMGYARPGAPPRRCLPAPRQGGRGRPARRLLAVRRDIIGNEILNQFAQRKRAKPPRPAALPLPMVTVCCDRAVRQGDSGQALLLWRYQK
ncbi:hypothetical protein HMPREF0591_5627, partial [Mycobacterium parascrofulaceum ATCC BAA-614]